MDSVHIQVKQERTASSLDLNECVKRASSVDKQIQLLLINTRLLLIYHVSSWNTMFITRSYALFEK